MPPSRLLALPTEVRYKIWTFALTSRDQPVRMQRSPFYARHRSLLRLLLVCSQIYDECFVLFYRHNTLAFNSTSALWTFLTTLSPARRKEITSLALEGYGMHYSSTQLARKAFELLGTCDRLTSFRLDLASEFRLRNDEVCSFWDPRHGYQPLDLGQEFERREWIAGMTSLKKLRGLLYASIRILYDDPKGDSWPRMVEIPAKGRWGKLCQGLRIRWKRPPLWGLEERGEAHKRTRRWRQGIDRILDKQEEVEISGHAPWYLYECVLENCMSKLSGDSEPDNWI